MSSPDPQSRVGDSPRWLRWTGLVLGPLACVVLALTLPRAVTDASNAVVSGLSPGGRMTIAIGAWLAIWWITEAIPIEAAALLPLAIFPLVGVASMPQAASPYADQVVFLFLGGMLLGSAIERWGLHKRIALHVMLALGASPPALVAGLLLATAVISMWVSNTAAAIMMLPIGVGVVSLAHAQHARFDGTSPVDRPARNFAIACMLAIAYGASIGGVATIIGTPPNGVMVGFIQREYNDSITFLEWAKLGVPVACLTLPVAWILLMVIFPSHGLRVSGAREMLRAQLRELGPIRGPEVTILGVFAFAALGWIFREPIAHALGLIRTRPNGTTEFLLTDAGVAILSALLLFLIPVRETLPGQPARWHPALDWRTAGRIPWGILLLFGGGLSLAAAIEANGVDDFVATLFRGLSGVHPLLVVLVVAAASVFLSEIGSNTAVATVLLPIMAVAAPALGVHPYVLCIAVALGVSLAFMMPSGTPPNALVFTSGHLRVPQMAKGGFALNLACVLIITAAAYWLAPLVITMPAVPIMPAAMP